MGQEVSKHGAHFKLDAKPPRLANGASSGQMSMAHENRSKVPLNLIVCTLKSRDLQVAHSVLVGAAAVKIPLSGCSRSGTPFKSSTQVGDWTPKAPGYSTIDAEVRIEDPFTNGLLSVLIPNEDVTVT